MLERSGATFRELIKAKQTHTSRRLFIQSKAKGDYLAYVDHYSAAKLKHVSQNNSMVSGLNKGLTEQFTQK